ncbi:MAG: SEC-C domain-containing protein [Burkholderiaceae bacterium]|nr:SEC-C domain-containing protein [Burkholderiaceae bacterium]
MPRADTSATPALPAGPDALPCPCGSGRSLAACCGRWHAGPMHLQAPDAEALMRSRYSAFVLDRRDYLLATWHPDTRPAALEPPQPGLKWLGLQVRERQQQDADHATVEFVARSKLGGRAQRLHELSRFVRVDGRWLYRDGDLR